MKKLIILAALIVATFTLASVRPTQAEANVSAKFSKPPAIVYVGHWYYALGNTDYSVYVYQDDPTSVAKVSANGGSLVNAAGTYDPDTRVATLESSIVNFSHELSNP